MYIYIYIYIFRAPSQGLESGFGGWVAGRGLAEKEVRFHRRRQLFRTLREGMRQGVTQSMIERVK